MTTLSPSLNNLHSNNAQPQNPKGPGPTLFEVISMNNGTRQAIHFSNFLKRLNNKYPDLKIIQGTEKEEEFYRYTIDFGSLSTCKNMRLKMITGFFQGINTESAQSIWRTLDALMQARYNNKYNTVTVNKTHYGILKKVIRNLEELTQHLTITYT